MMWTATMLVVHLSALGALGILWRHAPDAPQRLTLGILIFSTALFMWADVMALASTLAPYYIETLRWIAYEAEHVGVLMYVLRLFMVDQEHRCLPSFSRNSRN